MYLYILPVTVKISNLRLTKKQMIIDKYIKKNAGNYGQLNTSEFILSELNFSLPKLFVKR